MDRENVIKGLEGIFRCVSPVTYTCGDCPYQDNRVGCKRRALSDAIALLKEQEAKKVIKQTYHVMMNRDYENPVVVTRYDWLCPTCKSLLCRDIDVIDDNYHFCKVCGQAVKWK